EAEEAAVKLTEIGPRMNLTLMKVEDGFCSGEVLYHHHVENAPEEMARFVLYHHHVEKAPEEIARIRAELAEKQDVKARRQAEQTANVKRKKELERKQEFAKRKGGVEREVDAGEDLHPLDQVQETAFSSDDDEEHYRTEVGEAPEAGTFMR
ncbi:hypothetical protein T484DRAFT_1777916, partial [Baffinella frigidus]